MAKKKKIIGDSVSPSVSSTGQKGHVSTGIDEIENGFIVNISREGTGKHHEYVSKRFVAPNHATALRIASQGLSGLGLKGGKKKKGTGKGKRVAVKKV